MTVADGEFLVLVGPSGCGKSTLLRCVAARTAPQDTAPAGPAARTAPHQTAPTEPARTGEPASV